VPEALPATGAELAGADEVVARCAAGDYLRALLLTAARAFAGVPDLDPTFDAVLAAHHVDQNSRPVPWPDWCFDAGAAERVAQIAPESARLAFLAARCHASGEAGDVPLADEVSTPLLDSFNEIPDVRKWLSAYMEAAAVPGLWEQICRPGGPDAAAEYNTRRAAFVALYENGLQYRTAGGAYWHRQEFFLSRKPGARALFEHLKPNRPAPLGAAAKQQIAALLALQPEDATDEWVASTERVSGGVVQLRGNQRAELVRRAGEYLEVVARAWKAATALLQRPPQGEADRRRTQLRQLLPAALTRSEGRPWLPLLQRLTQGLTK
jgi:hypothetical protein